MIKDSCVILFQPSGGIREVIGPMRSESARLLAAALCAEKMPRTDLPSVDIAIASRMVEP